MKNGWGFPIKNGKRLPAGSYTFPVQQFTKPSLAQIGGPHRKVQVVTEVRFTNGT